MTSKTTKRFSPEVRARAVEWFWITKASMPRAGRRWCRLRPRSAAPGRRSMNGSRRLRLKALERKNRELRQANEILRKASAYFAAAELDRRFKP